MRRRAIAIVLTLFAVLLLFFGTAVYLTEFVITRGKERELEQRLAAIGATAAHAAEVYEVEVYEERLLRELAIAYDPAFTQTAAARGHAPLPAATLADIATLQSVLLRQVVDANRLASIAFITENGVVLASVGEDPLEAGGRPLLIELDQDEIDAAMRTGEAVANPYYYFEGVPQKRVYVPLPSDSDARGAAGAAGANGANEAGDAGDGEWPGILVRLEASADYFAEIEAVRRTSLSMALIGTALLIAVGAVTVGLMRRLERSTRELARLDRLRSLGTLASGLAHELRNPLGIMRLSAEEIAQGLGTHPNAQHLTLVAREIVDDIDRLGRLVGDVLSFSRGEGLSGQGVSRVAEVARSCATWLAKTVPMFWEVRSNHDDAKFAATQVAMRADALKQVLLNLVRNAYEAFEARAGTEPKPTISLKITAPDAAWIEVRVSDNGPGVSAAARATLFEPFHSSKGEGTGLGLAICRKLVESTGGTVTLTAKGDLGGATFVVRLPVVAGEDSLAPPRPAL